MNLRETKLFLPLKKWLNDKGFKVYSEVNLFYSPTDAVADNGEVQIGFEMKMNCSKKVISQAHAAKIMLGAAYIVIPTGPRKDKIEFCIHQGIGIVQVKGNEVMEILKPIFEKPYKKYDFTNWQEGKIAGKPNMKGEGIAQDCLRRIQEYLKNHPNATWRELHKSIPNHYSSYHSMQNSMRIWQNFTLS